MSEDSQPPDQPDDEQPELPEIPEQQIAKRVSLVTIEDEMKKSYLEYSMSVIVGRALPDIRDGLKPVHRRVLFAQHELSNTWSRPFKKSARIVGDVIGKYHPHGDQSVYDALVRMAQPFSMRYQLVDGQGNFGSVDGDSAAAMRYTEVRMKKLTNMLLADIEKETVDFGANYDGTLDEPLVFPARFPNLLVNGSEGIAVGMATRIPPHNLTEVITATLHRIDHPECPIDDLIAHVPAPDFPTGGILCSASGAQAAYRTGRGIIRVRAKTHFEEMGNDRWRIVTTELPFQVNKARLLEKIAELVRDKKLEGISDLRDESDRRGMRMVVELKRDSIKEVVLNKLFKQTAMQTTFGMILLGIHDNRPKICTLADMLDAFIAHRRDVVSRRCRYELRKAREREHILEGFVIALDNLDEVIKLIRASRDGEEASAGLQSTFGLTELQAKAILDMRLQRLTGLEREKILNELEEIRATIARLVHILSDVSELLKVIKGELEDVRSEFGDERRTEIAEISADFDEEDLIPNAPMVVTVTEQGYVKRTHLDTYRTQRRGGRGKRGMATKDEDAVVDLFVAKSHTMLLVFTDRGVCYQLKVHRLPELGANARGRPVVNLLEHLQKDESICAILPVPEFAEGQFVVTATKNGQIKKTDLMAYSRRRATGLIAVDIVEGDELRFVKITNGAGQLMLATASGMSIRFEESQVRPMGRGTRGVRGIRLDEGDEVVGMVALAEDLDPEEDLLTICAKGYGKRTDLEQYRLQNRGGRGIITIQTSKRNGKVVGILLARDGRELMMVTSGGVLIRTRMEQVSRIGRNTQGVRLIDLDKGSKVRKAASIQDFGDDEDEEADVEDGDGVESPTANEASDGSAEAEAGSVEEAEPSEPVSEEDDS
ncbi:MAG: DNA gyrase subunit A [Myxococcales bacterium]|nr:DNA gyrase subunit A [Myxococcales bacterium]